MTKQTTIHETELYIATTDGETITCVDKRDGKTEFTLEGNETVGLTFTDYIEGHKADSYMGEEVWENDCTVEEFVIDMLNNMTGLAL